MIPITIAMVALDYFMVGGILSMFDELLQAKDYMGCVAIFLDQAGIVVLAGFILISLVIESFFSIFQHRVFTNQIYAM